VRDAGCSGRRRTCGATDFFFFQLRSIDQFKKWVIITEISKEVENNAIPRLNEYEKQYVPRRTGAVGGSSGGGGSSGRS
jgi:hypothetical protein